ncbi:uncharacterized protein LOC130590114 [Beta vulgaris subsp. vulgaris]|uniref:uncharacterized protein LOC130590114 n=1 Tax=Beta vulgaris subsp. vulgaris TaxID=3555 RepID=UPI002548640F|nr:uncharacterized protein LOC130590114 [Beta vulgaris subsp. vulgaris]
MGDFNNVLNMEDRVGAPIRASECTDFRRCVECCSMEDMKATGCFYTWNNKQGEDTRVFSKIDRVMCNMDWMEAYPFTEANFLPEGEFDHCPMILTAHPQQNYGKKPFRYFDMWKHAQNFEQIIQDAWNTEVSGAPMFRLTQKLKKVKASLRLLNREGFTDLQAKEIKSAAALKDCQVQLHKQPDNINLRKQETEAAKEYKVAQEVNTQQAAMLQRPVSGEEVKEALWSIHGDKAPGPDGFGSHFYKTCWHIVGPDVIAAVVDFLYSWEITKGGDFQSILLLLRGFKLFSESSGLQANEQKSAIYCTGMENGEIQRILDRSGFVREGLPFKYLGVPICSKRISIADCERLSDKISARIKIWGSRNISFAGRVQLINSVLLSMHSYWAQVFVIPKTVMQDIGNMKFGGIMCLIVLVVGTGKLCNVKEKLKGLMTVAQLQQMHSYSIQEIYGKLTGDYEKLQWCQVETHNIFSLTVILVANVLRQ